MMTFLREAKQGDVGKGSRQVSAASRANQGVSDTRARAAVELHSQREGAWAPTIGLK